MKKIILTLFLGYFSLIPLIANSTGIAFDTNGPWDKAGSANCPGTTSCSLAVNVAGPHETVMCVITTQPTDTLTSVSESSGSTNLTTIGKTATNLGFEIYGYYLLNAPTGSYNIVAHYSTATNVSFICTGYTGTNDSSAIDTSRVIATSLQANFPATQITTAVDNDWIWLGAYAQPSSGTYTAGTNAFIRDNNSNENTQAADSNAAITPAGATTFQIHDGGSTQNWSGVQAAIEPLVSAAVTPQSFFWVFWW